MSAAAAAMVQAWLRASRSTQRCDRPVAEAAVRHAHRVAGLAPPDPVLWMDSPRGALVAALALVHRGHPTGEHVLRELQETLMHAVVRLLCAPGRREWPDHGCEIPPPQHVVESLLEPAERERLAPLGQSAPASYGSVSSFAIVHRVVPAGVWDSIRGTLEAQLCDRLTDAEQAALRDRPFGDPRSALGRDLSDQSHTHLCTYGDGYTFAAAALMLDAEGLAPPPALEATAEAIRQVGMWWPVGGGAVLSDRPTSLHLDAAGRTHREDGPAVEYADGWASYALAGYPVWTHDHNDRRTAARQDP